MSGTDGVVLKVEKGQGFTQALKQYLKDKGEEVNFSAAIWNDVIDTAVSIDKSRKEDGEASIFKGGSDRSDYTKNLLVMPGEIKLNDEEMGLILEKIKPKTEPKGETPKVETPKVETPVPVTPETEAVTPPVTEVKPDEVAPPEEKIVTATLPKDTKVSQESITNEDGSITTVNKIGEKVLTTSTRKKDDQTGVTTYNTNHRGKETTLKAFKMKLDDTVYFASVNMGEKKKTLTLSKGFSQELGRPHDVVYTFEQEKGAQFPTNESLMDMQRWKDVQ